MKSRTLRLFLEVFAGLVAGLLMLVGIGVWRLSEGPVSLSFLTPTIQNALEQIDSPFDIEISDTVLTWGGWDRAIDILITDVTLRRPGQNPIAVLPNVSMGLSVDALVRGHVAPTKLELMRPEVVVRRRQDGTFSFGFMQASEDGARKLDEAPMTPAMLDALMRPPEEDSALSFLKTVSIIDATVILDDRLAGLTWRMPDANIVLVRDDLEVRGNVSATLKADDEETKISAVLLRDFKSPDLTFSLSFDGFQPALIARALPEAAFLGEVQTPVNGSVGLQISLEGEPTVASLSLAGEFGRASLDLGFAPDGSSLVADVEFSNIQTQKLALMSPELAPIAALDTQLNGIASIAATLEGDIQFAQFEVQGAAGSLDLSEFDLGVYDFRNLSAFGRLSDAFETVVLDSLSIALLEEAEIELAGAAELIEGEYKIDLSGEATKVAFEQLAEIWPETIAADARNWLVPNLTKAFVPSATFELRARAPADTLQAIQIDQVGGDISVRDGTVHYFRPLPPVTGASAEIEFGADWFDIRASDGLVGGTINAKKARMEIRNIGTIDDTTITVDFGAPMADILDLLDREPLGLIRKLGIEPQDVSGDGQARLQLDFQLKKSLKTEQIIYQAEGRLENFGLAKTPFGGVVGGVVSGGGFDLALDPTGMTIAGSGLINSTPVTLNWRENFEDKNPVQSRYDLSGVFTDAAMTDLGFSPNPFVTGAAGVSLQYYLYRNGDADIVLNANLDAAHIEAELLRWQKAAGIPAALEASLRLPKEGAPTLERFKFESQDLQASGSALFAPEFADIQSVSLDRLSFPYADLSGLVRKAGAQEWDIQLSGPRIDIGPLLADEDEETGNDTTESADTDSSEPTLNIIAAFDEVLAGDGTRLANVSLAGRREYDAFQHLDFKADVSQDATLSINIRSEGLGNRLTVETEDGGAALSALDWTDRIRGGALKVNAVRPDRQSPYTGDILMENFTLTQAPALARLLEFVSITGAVSALSGPGMSFSVLEGDFAFKDGVAEIEFSRAYNASLGITASGILDINENIVDVKGAVAPIYVLNQIISTIPIIGDIVTGGDGAGLFAWNYEIKGPLEDADVSVNPLSVLAPGIIGRIFREASDAPASESEPVDPNN